MSDSDTVASCQGATWSYDPWDNRTAQTPTKGSCGMWSSSYTGNNQISGYSYDAAGNLLNDGSHSYTYDAENRINAVNGGSTATYVYDADGKRVSKKVSGVESDYIFDPSGNPMTIFSSGCGNCWASGFVFANGRQIAEYENSSTYFITTDQLGSTRLMTAMNKSVYDSMDYMPFGEQVTGGTGTVLKFTGKERDSESNLDNFGARYDSSALGRFMSPDWAATPEAAPFTDPQDPQTLNLYSYVRNNPMTDRDFDGHKVVCGPDTYSKDSNGNLVVHGGACRDELDWWDFPGYWFVGLTSILTADSGHQAWTGVKQVAYAYAGAYVSDAVVGFAVGKTIEGIGTVVRSAGGKVVVERVMSVAELADTERSGLLRGGRNGIHYLTDSAPDTAAAAQQQLHLSTMPEVKVTMEIDKSALSAPSPVLGYNGVPTGATERIATGKLPRA